VSFIKCFVEGLNFSTISLLTIKALFCLSDNQPIRAATIFLLFDSMRFDFLSLRFDFFDSIHWSDEKQ